MPYLRVYEHFLIVFNSLLFYSTYIDDLSDAQGGMIPCALCKLYFGPVGDLVTQTDYSNTLYSKNAKAMT